MQRQSRVDVFEKPQTSPFNLSMNAVLWIFNEDKLTREEYSALLNGMLAAVPYMQKCHPISANLQMPHTSEKSVQILRVTLNCGAISHELLYEYARRIDEVLRNHADLFEIAERPYVPNLSGA